jgi:hypothetical protein
MLGHAEFTPVSVLTAYARRQAGIYLFASLCGQAVLVERRT